ncbi:MAG: TolC family protein [Proteobacteria bacterium]|nr:TolC family protein [Pseudomonadota bacterium]NOG60343.1 TolC family protein [Pseudomonadota bacterium]
MYFYGIFKKLSVIVLIVIPISTIANELSLAEAERLALDADFIIKQYNTRADSLNEIAIAEEQLPDPKAKFGVMNIPVDGFSRTQEPMTQLQFGVQQAFPRGDTLHYKRLRTEDMADVDKAKALEQEKKVLRSLRNSYLNLFLNVKTELILEQNRTLFTQLLDITQRQYAVGRDNQHDVLRAQLELALVDDRIAEIVGAKEIALAELTKWIGNDYAQRPLPDSFPELSSFVSEEEIVSNLNFHPMILMEDAVVNAKEKNIKIAEEQYKPGWMLDLTYGQRSGNNLDGSSRDDFASAMVMVDLPLFTDKRQDKRLSASKLEHQASQFVRTDRLLELKRQVEKEHANWVRLGKRLELYETRALVDAEQNSESTLKAYQNDLTDFTTLMRARLTELNTQLDMLKIRVDRAKSQANLLYYTRETL